MTEKFLVLAVCLASLVALTACGSMTGNSASAEGAGTPVTASTTPGSDAVRSSQPANVTPDLADIVTLDPNGASIRVLWTVSGYVLGKGFSGDEQAAKALLFKPLDINDTEIIFDGKACRGVTFEQQTVNADEYLASSWQTTPKELGIDVQQLQVFKTNCSLPGFQ